MNEEQMSEAEAEKILGDEEDVVEEAEATGDENEPVLDPDAVATEVPDWATVPPNVKLPKKGLTVAFIRIPARWTADPASGDRWCCCWAITETEERLAYARARGDQMRSVAELAKQTIRVVDGEKADWSGEPKPGSVISFWAKIGPKGRQMIRNYYVRTHMVQESEVLDFFSKHFVSMTVS